MRSFKAEKDPREDALGRVRADQLREGEAFTTAYGQHLVARAEGQASLPGYRSALDSRGQVAWMADGALVTLGRRGKGWLG